MTLLTQAADGTARSAGDSFVTGSYTPSANKLILAGFTTDGDDTPDVATLTGNGGTWVQIGTLVRFNTVGTPLQSVRVYRTMIASPTTGALTIAHDSHWAGCTWCVIEHGGVDTSGTNGSGAIAQFKPGSADAQGTGTITMDSAPAAESAMVGFFGYDANLTGPVHDIIAGTGFTEISENGHGSPARGLFVEWRNSPDQTVDWSEDTETYDWGGMSVEVKVAPAAATARNLALLGVGE